MPSFKIIGLPVLEKKIFKGFYHIWAWRPHWSRDLDNLYKLLFPLPRDAPCEVWLWMAKRFQRRRCLKNFERTTTTITTDARALVYYKLTFWAWRLRWAKNHIHEEQSLFWLFIYIISRVCFLLVASINAMLSPVKPSAHKNGVHIGKIQKTVKQSWGLRRSNVTNTFFSRKEILNLIV